MTLRVASIIASSTAGGIGPVCRYAAEGMAENEPWQVSLICLHDPEDTHFNPSTGLRITSLGLTENPAAGFLHWLEANPQDVIITSDVSLIEPAFPHLPESVCHIVQVHDSMKRYRQVAIRNGPFIDGVVTVAGHILRKMIADLEASGFKGIARVVHNGADFPPILQRSEEPNRLRLLFVGRMDAIKGIFDLPLILAQLKAMAVPFELKLVGGDSQELRDAFNKAGLTNEVTWQGRIPHDECYQLAGNADIFLMTSRMEAFGMVTIEAMGMGCVPIAYRIDTGSTEIIESGSNGMLVLPGNIKAFADTLKSLHEDRDRLRAMSQSAIERARTCFSAQRMSLTLADAIKATLTQRQDHPPARLRGYPRETGTTSSAGLYQRLPTTWRLKLRRMICAHPPLANWVFSRL